MTARRVKRGPRAGQPVGIIPTWEQYAPLLVAIGAASDGRPRATFPITDSRVDGVFTKRSVQLG